MGVEARVVGVMVGATAVAVTTRVTSITSLSGAHPTSTMLNTTRKTVKVTLPIAII
jgi:hypothetical protein